MSIKHHGLDLSFVRALAQHVHREIVWWLAQGPCNAEYRPYVDTLKAQMSADRPRA